MNFFKLKLLIFITLIGYTSLGLSKVCVLGFERPEHYTSVMLRETFSNKPNITVKTLSRPADIIDCAKIGSEEIIIVAHTLYNKSTPNRSKLIFYRNLTESEYSRYVAEVSSLLGDLQKTTPRQVSPFLRRRFKRGRSKDQIMISKLKTIKRDIISGRKYYKFDKFHDIIFDSLVQIIESEFIATGEVRLKKIRIAACAEDSLKQRYTQLSDLFYNFGIEIDWQPSSSFASYLSGVQSVVLDKDWLRKSLD